MASYLSRGGISIGCRAFSFTESLLLITWTQNLFHLRIIMGYIIFYVLLKRDYFTINNTVTNDFMSTNKFSYSKSTQNAYPRRSTKTLYLGSILRSISTRTSQNDQTLDQI